MVLPWAENGDVLSYLEDLVEAKGLSGNDFLSVVNKCVSLLSPPDFFIVTEQWP